MAKIPEHLKHELREAQRNIAKWKKHNCSSKPKRQKQGVATKWLGYLK